MKHDNYSNKKTLLRKMFQENHIIIVNKSVLHIILPLTGRKSYEN
jgi:hypothetical protein